MHVRWQRIKTGRKVYNIHRARVNICLYFAESIYVPSRTMFTETLYLPSGRRGKYDKVKYRRRGTYDEANMPISTGARWILDLFYEKHFLRLGRAAFSPFSGSKETTKKLAVRVRCRWTLAGQRNSMPTQVLFFATKTVIPWLESAGPCWFAVKCSFDKGQLRQTLDNLIKGAVSHAPHPSAEN